MRLIQNWTRSHYSGKGRKFALCSCLVLLTTAAGPAEHAQGSEPQAESRVTPVGDVRLPQVTPFVIVHDPATGQLGLYQVGEAIFAGDNPLPVGKVTSIEPRSLWLALPSGGTVQVPEGSKIPGPQTLIFVRSAWLDSLRFQLRVGGAAASKNYSVVGIQGRRAILERVAAPGEDAGTGGMVAALGSSGSSKGSSIAGTAFAAAGDGALADAMKRIPFAEVAPDTWEIPEEHARELGNHLWPMLAETLRSALPVVTFNDGVGLRLDNSLGTGTLDREGFRIDYVRLARRTGLEVGDRILSVNDQPVNSAGSLVRLYRELSSDGSVSEVKVMIRRAGEQRTITYRLR
ncbi:MAG: hypothetical protein U1B94_01700 [candidate division NC10 bacterium]|nr:hypothetical protein [candidate division NC10 bacterium]